MIIKTIKVRSTRGALARSLMRPAGVCTFLACYGIENLCHFGLTMSPLHSTMVSVPLGIVIGVAVAALVER